MRSPLPWLLLAMSLPALAADPSGQALNTEGFRLYQAGKYPEALEKFTAAAEADPKLALAHYNIAATLGVLRKQGRKCEYDAFLETMLERLQKAVELDPRRLTRAQKDADLTPLHTTVGWQRLLGRQPENDADLPEILRHVTWASDPGGMMSTRHTLSFPSPGRAVLETSAFNEKTDRFVRSKKTGTYTLEGRTLRLSFPQQKPLEGRVAPGGGLEFGEPLGTLVDTPSECDA